MKKHYKMLNQFFSNQTKRTKYISATLVILVVAVVGSVLLLGSHAATPYVAINADSGTLTNGATKQTCTGASDGTCVVFGGSGIPAPSSTCNPISAWVPVNSTSFQPMSDSGAASSVCAKPEIRPNNSTANQYIPSASELQAFYAASNPTVTNNIYTKYVTGHYSGTTDEIIQWAAWKWGIPEDWLRAEYALESSWVDSDLGDLRTVSQAWYNLYPPQARVPNTLNVYQSMGLTQVKWIPDGSVGAGTEPLRWKSTAFNVDFQASTVRFYFDDPNGLRSRWGDSTYQKGQTWNSIGGWYEPYPWNNTHQQSYVSSVQYLFNEQVWTMPCLVNNTGCYKPPVQ